MLPPEFGTGDHRGPFVEEQIEGAEEAGLALTTFAEQHHVVTRDESPFELWFHRLLETDDAGPRITAVA